MQDDSGANGVIEGGDIEEGNADLSGGEHNESERAVREQVMKHKAEETKAKRAVWGDLRA